MKMKYFVIVIILLICGCSKKEEVVEEKKILSTGELICAYKENRVNENVMYTSIHVFNFNDNGILDGARNIESVEFDGTLDSTKEFYKKALEENIKEYENIPGLTIEKKIEDKKYLFEIKMDNKKMTEEKKEELLLNLSRINIYKVFTADGYTCE